MVRWFVKNDPFFPEPVRSRGGTFFQFEVEAVEVWMRDRGMVVQQNLLVPNPSLLTTDEVLKLLKRQDSKGSRGYLATQIKLGHFPKPVMARRGRQGQNLWAKTEVDQHLAQYRGYSNSRRGRPIGTRKIPRSP